MPDDAPGPSTTAPTSAPQTPAAAVPTPAAATSAGAPTAPAAAPATPAVAAAAEPPKDPIALNLARLAAGEKRLAAERADLTKRATELSTREKAITESASQAKSGLEALRARAAKGEHDDVLRELGLDYSTLTKARLSRGAQPKASADAPPGTPSAQAVDIVAEIAKGVEAALAKREASAKEAQEASATKAWTEAVSNFEGVVKSGGLSRYEMLSAELEEYPQRIHDALRELAIRQPELTFETAADKLEEFFVAKSAKRASSSKVQALLAGASKQTETATPRAQPGQATADSPRTLTNALAAERASSTDDAPPSKPLSRSAQIRAAREAAQEEDRRITALARR